MVIPQLSNFRLLSSLRCCVRRGALQFIQRCLVRFEREGPGSFGTPTPSPLTWNARLFRPHLPPQIAWSPGRRSSTCPRQLSWRDVVQGSAPALRSGNGVVEDRGRAAAGRGRRSNVEVCPLRILVAVNLAGGGILHARRPRRTPSGSTPAANSAGAACRVGRLSLPAGPKQPAGRAEAAPTALQALQPKLR